MSYTNTDIFPELINKKVLFFDLETTGLVKTENNLPQELKYPSYKLNKKYDKSRIVQIGYIKFNDFDYDYEVSEENISSIIVKPDGFVIPDDAIAIHKITNEQANEEGIGIKKALKKIKKIIKDIDYIVGYNIYFDVNILMNELYRVGYKSTINKIKDLINNQKILCVGELAKQYKGSGMPRQTRIYEEIFGSELVNAHNAVYDVIATINLFYWFYNNINKLNTKIKKLGNNYGKQWTDDEYEKLIDNLLKNKPIKEICEEHGRNSGGINSAIARLIQGGKIKENNNNYILTDHVDYTTLKDTTDNQINIVQDIIKDKNNLNNLSDTTINSGKKWESDEITNLIKEVNKEEDINNIALNHKRTLGGIKGCIRKLLYENDNRIKNKDSIISKYDIFNDKLKHNILKNILNYKNIKEICDNESCTLQFTIKYLNDLLKISNKDVIDKINILLENTIVENIKNEFKIKGSERRQATKNDISEKIYTNLKNLTKYEDIKNIKDIKFKKSYYRYLKYIKNNYILNEDDQSIINKLLLEKNYKNINIINKNKINIIENKILNLYKEITNLQNEIKNLK